MGSLVAELAEKLSSATNSLDFDEQTMFLNTSADTVGIGTNAPASKLDVRGTMQVGVNDTGYDVQFFGDAAGAAMIWDTSANSLLVRGATADAAGSSGRIVLQTAQVAVADGDILGRVDFQAPLETQGSDGALVTASIWAEADDTFTATVNSTELVFATATDDAVVERMRIDKDGNVGIGTTAPLQRLTVHKTGDFATSSAAGAQDNLFLTSATTSADGAFGASIGFSRIEYQDRRSASISAVQGTADVDQVGLAFHTHSSATSDDALVEAMRIGYDGKVGIGTTAPGANLHVVGDSSATLSDTQFVIEQGDTNGAIDRGGGIAFGIIERTAGTPRRNAYILAAKENSNNADDDTYLAFGTRSDGGNVAERMRINSDGKVGIGTTSPAEALEVSGTSMATDFKTASGQTNCGTGNTTLFATAARGVYLVSITNGYENWSATAIVHVPEGSSTAEVFEIGKTNSGLAIVVSGLNVQADVVSGTRTISWVYIKLNVIL